MPRENHGRGLAGPIGTYQQVELVAAVGVGACPVRVGVVAVGGEIQDAAGVAVRLGQGVLGLAAEEGGGLAAEGEFEGVDLAVAIGLDGA